MGWVYIPLQEMRSNWKCNFMSLLREYIPTVLYGVKIICGEYLIAQWHKVFSHWLRSSAILAADGK